MKIAVAYKDGEIFEHFGHAEMFAIYDYTGEYVDECTKTLVDASGLHGHQQMADLMKEKDVAAVIVGRMGEDARALLLSYGIVPVPGYSGNADTAADLLITGRLPVGDGGACGGGCGGCGGGCHHDEEGGCGCGCDCGCGEE